MARNCTPLSAYLLCISAKVTICKFETGHSVPTTTTTTAFFDAKSLSDSERPSSPFAVKLETLAPIAGGMGSEALVARANVIAAKSAAIVFFMTPAEDRGSDGKRRVSVVYLTRQRCSTRA